VLQSREGPVSRADLLEDVERVAEVLRREEAVLLLTNDDVAEATEFGLDQLLLRRIVVEGPDGIRVRDSKRRLLAYTAASIGDILDASAETRRQKSAPEPELTT
jgi:hypothetical protein